jgi:hypothetical protein
MQAQPGLQEKQASTLLLVATCSQETAARAQGLDHPTPVVERATICVVLYARQTTTCSCHQQLLCWRSLQLSTALSLHGCFPALPCPAAVAGSAAAAGAAGPAAAAAAAASAQWWLAQLTRMR